MYVTVHTYKYDLYLSPLFAKLAQLIKQRFEVAVRCLGRGREQSANLGRRLAVHKQFERHAVIDGAVVISPRRWNVDPRCSQPSYLVAWLVRQTDESIETYHSTDHIGIKMYSSKNPLMSDILSSAYSAKFTQMSILKFLVELSWLCCQCYHWA